MHAVYSNLMTEPMCLFENIAAGMCVAVPVACESRWQRVGVDGRGGVNEVDVTRSAR